MTDSSLRTYFAILAVAMLLSLIVALTWRPEPAPPAEPAALARWVEEHPSDWMASADLTESALDLDAPTRFDLWRAAHEHTEMLSPLRPNARLSFVRSAFFHWYELGDREKKAMLAEAAPMLRDPENLRLLGPAILRLTGDFGYLRRVASDDYQSLMTLRDLAANNGLFDEYRRLRRQASRQRMAEFLARIQSGAPIDPTDFIPNECNRDEHDLLAAIVTELHDRPLDKNPSNPFGLERLADYAIRHGIGPLDGVAFSARDSAPPIRARLAVATGDIKQANVIESAADADNSAKWADYYAERAAHERSAGDVTAARTYEAHAETSRKERLAWSGFCGTDVCTAAQKELVLTAPRPYVITLTRAAGDEVAPYVELTVDDDVVDEGPVGTEQTFTTEALGPGLHRVHLRVVNPFTPNLEQRRVRIVHDLP